jgi:hypothetical protein
VTDGISTTMAQAGVWEQLHHRLLDWLGDDGQVDWSQAASRFRIDLCSQAPTVVKTTPAARIVALSIVLVPARSLRLAVCRVRRSQGQARVTAATAQRNQMASSNARIPW